MSKRTRVIVAAVSIAFLAALAALADWVRPPLRPDPSNRSDARSIAESAPSPTPKKDVADYIPKFRSLLSSIDKDDTIILGVSPGRVDGEVKIKVSNEFHYQPYQVRLQAAQALWKGWASIYSPEDGDKARIQLVDLMGNEVGGSRVWAGSLIWVQEQ